ncbi:MAG: GldG family protein [Candidatus Binatia bacterium]
MSRSPSRQWLHLALVVLLVFGIAAVVQAIAERHSVRFDLTPTGEHSLSGPTVKALATLAGPMHVTVYYRRDDFQKTADLLSLFKGADPDFHYELLDLDRYPGRARQDGVDGYGKAVLRHGAERLVVDATNEQGLAGGLLRLARGRPTVIVFLTGHGERDFTDVTSPTGYGELRQILQQESHVVGSLGLLKQEDVPAEVDLVIVAGPKNDLLENEAAALDRYLERGGHVLVLVDPVPLPNLQRLAARHGIEVSLDVVRDRTNQIMGSDPFTVPVPSYQRHPITSVQTTPALFAVARSVAGGRRDGADVSTIALTYTEAWAIRDFQRAAQPAAEPLEGEDRAGPVPVMAAVSRPVGEKNESRLVVAGDSDFAANGMLNLLGNRDLVLNAVSWSVSAEALVADQAGSRIEALRPLSPLVLTGNQGRWIFLLAVVVQPAVVLGFGSVVALRRRWRG